MTETQIPQEVLDAFKVLVNISREEDQIRFRMCTYGERGLYPKLKSVRAQLGKAKKDFIKKFPDYANLTKKV